MAESLFTTQTPSSPNVNDAAAISLGTTLTFDTAGDVTHIRFYAPTTVSGTYIGGLYQITAFDTGGFDPGNGTGTLLGSSVTFGSVSTGTWNQAALASPIAVTTSNTYRVVVYSSAGRYVSVASLFTAAAIENGSINGLRHNQGGGSNVFNGTYNYATGISYTNDHFGGEGYLVDVVFEPGGVTAAATPSPLVSPGPAAVRAATW